MIGANDFGVFFNPNEFGSPAILHLPGVDKPVTVIFKDPNKTAKLKHGGFIDNKSPSILLPSADAIGICIRSLVTVAGQQWMVERPPAPDGNGMTQIYLGVIDANQSAKPAIQY